MNPQDYIKGGYFTAAGTAVVVNVDLGWLPDEVEIFNEAATAEQIVSVKFLSTMGTGKSIQDYVLADNGATGKKTRQFLSSGGIALLNTVVASPNIWTASTAYVIGDIVHPVTNNGYIYECLTAGTSHSAEPTWLTVVGGTTAEGGGAVTWTCRKMDYSPAKFIKLQGFTVPAALQINSTKCHWRAMRYQV